MIQFYKVMSYKKAGTKNKRPRKLDIKLNAQIMHQDNIAELEHLHFENIFTHETMSSVISAENLLMNDIFSHNFDTQDDYTRVSPEDVKPRCPQICDEIITQDVQIVKKRRSESIRQPVVQLDYFIMSEIRSLLQQSHKEDMSIEAVRRESSVLSHLQQSSSILKSSHFMDMGSFDGDYNEMEPDSKFDIDDCGSSFIFNQVVMNLCKYEKGIGMLRILELATNGDIVVEQSGPYQNIQVNKCKEVR